MFSLSGRKNRIFLVSSQNDTVLGATFTKKGGRYHIGRVQKIQDIQHMRCASCRILLHSPQANIIHDYFPKAKPQVLEMMLDDRIRKEGFLAADASFSHAFKVTKTAGKRQQILVVSLPTQLVERAFDIAEDTRARRLKGITPVPAALAALMGRVCDKPVMAVIMRNSSCEFLVCHRGLPLMMQASPVERDSPDAPAMLLEGMKAVARRAQRALGVSVETVLFLGHGVDYSSVVSEGFQVLKPDISRFVSAEDPADLTRYPEFAGALFAGRQLDYIPQSWHLSYRIQDAACYAGLAAGAAGLFMACLTLNMQKDVEKYRTLYAEQHQKVSKATVRILGMLPDSTEKAGFEKLMGYWKQNLKEPRLDDTLLKIAQALPLNTNIERFRAMRQNPSNTGQGAETRPPLPVPGLPAPSSVKEPASSSPVSAAPITYEMDIITRGDFQEVRTRFEHSIENLRKWFILTDITWRYDQDTARGFMKCSFDTREPEEKS